MIIVDDVYKRYQTDHGPGKWVLQGVSFTIPPKVSVGLVGCNGAGKSTLLRLVGGVDTPNRGSVERCCRVSWPMGFGGGLQGALTGRQNAKFVCRVHGHEDDIPDRLAYIQDFADLGESFDEPVKTYSTGMKSRLQFGLSLAFNFDVYISDEVTAAGDAFFKEKAATAFKSLADHASLIMVSHGVGTLRQFCTAGIWLNEGHAYWFDDISDALKEYKKSQLNHQMDNLIRKQTSKNQEEAALEIEKTKLIQTAFVVLEKGMSGSPEKVCHEEGERIILAAMQIGMELVGVWQLDKLGYQLKPNVTPTLIKYSPPHKKHMDFYELHSQCVKIIENAK